MHLRDYLFKKRITKKEFGKNINYSARYVGHVAEGRIKPGIKFAKIVELATKGEVTADEILNYHPD